MMVPKNVPKLACAQGNSNQGPIYYYVGSEARGHLTVYQFVTNPGTGRPAEQRFLKMIRY